jgi:hypothetical protein
MRWTVVVLALAAAVAVADPELEALVGAEDYAALGLAKLEPAEQRRLAAWLRQRLPAPAAAPVAAAAPAAAPTPASAAAPVATLAATAAARVEQFGLEDVAGDHVSDRISARIIGRFEGWNGKSVFKLDNGQVWRQTGPGSYRYVADDPEVTIERAAIGFKLRVVATQRSVQVRRVR